jgi:Family of unknown function (DUF5681)
MARTKVESTSPKKIEPPTPGNRQENRAKPKTDHLVATQFKPEQSGNPNGRPRKMVTEALNELLAERVPGDKQKRTKARLLADVLFTQAMKGKTQAAIEIIDRTEGRAVQGHEVSGPQGGAIPTSYLPPEESERRLAEILARHGLKAVPLDASE